jgi:putative restriction endonuclease
VLPCSLAWSAFGEKNGVPDLGEFRSRIAKYRRADRLEADPSVGCGILTEPFFWPEEQWIPIPADWASNIVQGKSYDDGEAIGATLWQDVLARLRLEVWPVTIGEQDQPPRYGDAYLARARLGQGAFRVLVTEAYQKRCAITGERTLPVLEAAHIQPFAAEGPHRVSNGLLLRSDLHTLFDRGYVTVTPDLRIHVSKRIREEFENGRDYYAHQGKSLRVLPGSSNEHPASEFLRWHNEQVYEQ